MSGAEFETVGGERGKEAWERAVREAGRGRCANCGGDDRVRPHMVVPVDAGGKLVHGNGVLLCRSCELAMESVGSVELTKTKRPVNFWVSQALYAQLNSKSGKTSFRSMAGLIRFLMAKYVIDPDRFDDLAQYQDAGTDVKVSVWVEGEVYARFKALVDRRGYTVTDALKGLIRLFEFEAKKLLDNETKREC